MPFEKRDKKVHVKRSKKKAVKKSSKTVAKFHTLSDYLKADDFEKSRMERELWAFEAASQKERESCKKKESLANKAQAAINKAKISKRISEVKTVSMPVTSYVTFYTDVNENFCVDCVEADWDADAAPKREVKAAAKESQKRYKDIKKEFTAILKDIGISKNSEIYEELWDEAQFYNEI